MVLFMVVQMRYVKELIITSCLEDSDIEVKISIINIIERFQSFKWGCNTLENICFLMSLICFGYLNVIFAPVNKHSFLFAIIGCAEDVE